MYILHYVNTTSALLTDLYQLTMAYSYWKAGLHERQAVFQLFFRRQPFRSGFAIAAGLGPAIDYLLGLRFTSDDIAYLRTLRLFDEAFLRYLEDFRFECDVDAVYEGTAVFPHEPLIRVVGPILQAQLVETALLNIINFQTLIATKAARIVQAARGKPVLEFGLRRAQGPDGALSASRAAYIGGCEGTSNVLAGKTFGIPVRGTHAHSWVMAFDDEPAAFAAYAEAMPHNALFLVDTYDTLQGVRNAVAVGKQLRERGHKLGGVRLDSGDLAWLSKEARSILDESAFHDARIVATNDLDEHVIESLREQEARIDVWGVGTRLVTGSDEAALGGVYKLGAIRNGAGEWLRKIKVSDQNVKTSIPGSLQVRRFRSGDEIRGDMIWDALDGEPGSSLIIDPADATRRKSFGEDAFEDLLLPILERGEGIAELPPLVAARENPLRNLASLPAATRRLTNPHTYPVGLEERLHERRLQMIRDRRAA